MTLGLGQVYISLGDRTPDGSIDARMFWKPLVTPDLDRRAHHGVWRALSLIRHDAFASASRARGPQSAAAQPRSRRSRHETTSLSPRHSSAFDRSLLASAPLGAGGAARRGPARPEA